LFGHRYRWEFFNFYKCKKQALLTGNTPHYSGQPFPDGTTLENSLGSESR